MKKLHLKRRYKVIGGILVFISLILFIAPRAGKRYIVRNSKELIGRKLDIKKIRINYFSGTVRIYDTRLYEKDEKTVFCSFKLFRINLDYLPLLQNEFYVRSVSLDDPYVQVLQKGDEFNFSDLTSSDTVTVSKDTIPSAPTKYVINNIHITSGYVKYTDLHLNHTIALDRLNLTIPGFTWNSDSTNLNVGFRFVEGGGLSSGFEMNQADSTYALKLRLDSLNLNIFEPYAKSYLNISSLRGFLTDSITVNGSLSSVMNLSVRGNNRIDDFSLNDTLGRRIFAFKDLTVDIETVRPDRNIYRLGKIVMEDPYILFEMVDSTNNWLTLMRESEPAINDSLTQSSDSIVSSPLDYSFGKLIVSGGTLEINDKTLRYPFKYTVDNLAVVSTPVENKKGFLNINIKAGLNGTGNFSAEASLDPDKLDDMNFQINIGEFRMKDLDSYFRHYFGFPVAGGIMNFKTEDNIRPGSLVSNNSIYFRKFTLEKPINGKVEYHIPLRLALAVLSDKDGIIDINAPVESKGNEVKVKKIGKIIFRAIGNLFIKAAVSPIKLLSSSYNVDPSTLQEIPLSLTGPSPSEKAMKSVDILADILNKKPGLNLDLYYVIDRAEASDSLAVLLTRNAYLENNKTISRTVNVADSSLLRFVQGNIPEGSMTPGGNLRMLCRSYIGNDKLNMMLDSIAGVQCGFIKDYLNKDKNIPENRFRVITIAPDTIKPVGNLPSFRTYFTVEGE